MSIEIIELTKKYGNQIALDKASFKVGNDEVVGLIGPNGAGKSTLMKIVTCYIPATSGRAFVNGMDVINHPYKIKSQIGYLSESNPLYLQMYVREFLEYIANVHKITNVNSAIKNMLEKTGLEKESHKKIGQLSKGYKQRVGIAQALIHNPSVIILDEPTSGLDPNQLIEIRNLIKSISKDKTLILSSHNLREIEAICTRTIIINNGNIVLDCQPKDYSKYLSSKKSYVVEFTNHLDLLDFKNNLNINEIDIRGDKKFEIFYTEDKDINNKILNYSIQTKNPIISLNQKELELENIFKKLTSKN